MRATLIFNPGSGSGNSRELCEAAAARIRLQGWDADLADASQGREIAAAARVAVARKVDVVAACGGDGTVSAVASVTAGTPAALAVLPAGTLNHFARDLGIPANFDKAVQVLLNGRVRHIDIGQVNGLRFLNNSSLGLYPMLVRDREARERSGRSRLLAFAWAAATVLRRFRFLGLDLEIDGQLQHRETPFLFVGNNRYDAEGLNLGRRRVLDEGKLHLYVSDRTGRLGLARIALSAVFHRLRRNHDFVMVPAEKVVVRTPRKHLHVALDGEVFSLHPPLRYSIRQAFLKVIAP